MPLPHEVLIRPIITEKFSAEAETPRFVFEVHAQANKQEIAREVEKRFKVTVESVNTVVRKGKAKAQLTRRGRFEGRTGDSKRAVVTLAKGQKIDFFGGVEA